MGAQFLHVGARVSETLYHVLNAIALESERVRTFAREATEQAVPSLVQQGLTLRATPTSAGAIDATNLAQDPEGFALGALWAASNATLTPLTTDLPPRFSRAVTGTATGAGAAEVRHLVTPASTGTYYWYVLARTSYTTNVMSVRLRENFGGFTVLSTVATALGSQSNWALYGGSATLTGGSTYRIELASTGTPAASTTFEMTGATLSATDPGEAFTGDFEPTLTNTYSWEGARQASKSVRRGQSVDLLALQEREREFNISPVGMTFTERKHYLQQRLLARHKPYGSTFVEIIASVAGISPALVRVDEDYDSYTFNINIAYPSSGVLAERIEQLVEDIKPAHLKVGTISWGTFLADINEAGDPV
jgi:hypothetical protein